VRKFTEYNEEMTKKVTHCNECSLAVTSDNYRINLLQLQHFLRKP